MDKPPKSPGARFYKADFHTHTPGSADFKEKSVSPEDIIEVADRVGLELLAITDHNTAAWVDRIRAASKGKGVTIVPGAEITTPEGHILALFDIDCEVTKIEDLLVRIGIPRNQHGREEAISTSHAEEIIREIQKAGGLSIAAHANENNGLLKTKGQYKLKIVPMQELAALELTKQGDIERFCVGKVSQDYAAKACTHSSDSHCLAEIGRRVTYLKMHSVSLHGIQQALLDYPVRVRFPWDYKQPLHPRIVSLAADQGFFGGLKFPFHEGLNCLVGGKGTGKSTAIELLRYCFDDISQFPNIQEDHKGKIKSLVGDGGAIVVEYLDGDGELKTIRREVQPWEADREVRDASGNPVAVENPPAFFSQGELVQIASSAIAQMDLIDRRLDLTEEEEKEAEAIDKLVANARELVSVRQRIDVLNTEINDPERGKTATSALFKKLERRLKHPVLKQFPLWEAEQEYLRELHGTLETLPSEVNKALEKIDLNGLRVAPSDQFPNIKVVRKLKDLDKKAEEALENVKKEFLGASENLKKRVEAVRNGIAPLFERKKDEHDRVLKALGEADLRKANAQFRSLGKRMDGLQKYEKELRKLNEHRVTLESMRQELLANLQRARRGRYQKRAQKAAEYQEKLGGLVRINVIQAGDRGEFAKRIRELSRRGYLKDGEIQRISEGLDPVVLLRCVLNRDIQRIAKDAGITQEVARRLVESFSEKKLADLFDLEVVAVPDRPEVYYQVAPGREKQLRELSTGQKGTVIITLAMTEGTGPLVIDQPEEPLDTQSIYGQVVQTLRRSKDDRQFIFTTHNPNIAVGADAELSHVLDADADRGRIESSGGIDDNTTNKMLLIHLEGGEEALRLRVKKYGLDDKNWGVY